MGLRREARAEGRAERDRVPGREGRRERHRVHDQDTQDPRERELHILYYRAANGDMYRVRIDYPRKGHFADGGREIARTVVANREVAEP
ncbi:hypothetical protein [Streptomyces mutabilis]|nr:hypothetical protein [Streptomyces mutabilis]GGQ05999.1 hypothetical protein GCM10010279_11580 [Streptomyces mutabilis]